MRKPIEEIIKEKQKVDLGFWDINKEYIEDIQEVDLEKE
jgi:hypothetical protein